MSWTPPSKPGDSSPDIAAAKLILATKYPSYSSGVNDGSPFYTARFGEVLREFSRRVNDGFVKGQRQGPKIPTPGVFDWATKVQLGIIARAAGTPTPAQPLAPEMIDTWALSAPGSGADWNQGPPFELGELLLKFHGVHHLPLGYKRGGYLGFMGGDSKDSYLDVIGYEAAEMERRIREDILVGHYGLKLSFGERVTEAHVAALRAKAPKFKIVGLSYSQSSEGMIRAAAGLFGEGGVFDLLRPFLVGIVAFGNPVRVNGATTRYGRTPAGGGISDWRPPAWLAALVIDIVNEGPGAPDFYACTTSRIAKIAYGVIVRAETELPFVLFLAKILIPAMLNILSGGIFSTLLGPFAGLAAPSLLGTAAGGAMNPQQLGQLINMAGSPSDPAADAIIAEILELLTPTGLLGSIMEMIPLLISLQGIAVHGDYFAPKAEFGGRNGVQVGLDVLRPLVAA